MHYDNLKEIDKGEPEQVMETYAENYDIKELIKKNFKGMK